MIKRIYSDIYLDTVGTSGRGRKFKHSSRIIIFQNNNFTSSKPVLQYLIFHADPEKERQEGFLSDNSMWQLNPHLCKGHQNTDEFY